MKQEDEVDNFPIRPRRTIPLLREKRKTKVTVASLYDNAQIMGAMKRKAKEIEANLKKTHRQCPTLIRLLMPSHLAPRFKLRLPKRFCYRNMPLADKQIRLEGEKGRVFPASYLHRGLVIAGGWKAFAVDHGLAAGDILVFQLVKPLNFKVYIVRVNAVKEVDVIQSEAAGTSIVEFEDSSENNSLMDDDDEDDDDVGFELDPGIESGTDSNMELLKSNANNNFERVKCFEDFKIVANGSVISGKLPELIRFKYYQLCLSQRSFLHRDLLKGLNVGIISGMIADICDIAGAIRAMSKVVPKKDLETWGSKLKGFKELGMNVGFLLARLGKLELLADKANGYERLMKERGGMKQELQNLVKQARRVKEKLELVDKEIVKLGVAGSGSVESDFLELAKAPW
ncbi:unnamed protein product [Linum trigynum]|uniref:TF-B3 domain-containing protein n=1 Tax=Linum trigynum TaxID=586398 RepID=A0AAV2EU61_9ROSI